jgi:hypothetical protein
LAVMVERYPHRPRWCVICQIGVPRLSHSFAAY